MYSYDPPKRRALPEDELLKLLENLPNNQTGLDKAQVVLQRQAGLRADDQREFEAWLEAMRSDGSREAARAVNLAFGLVSPEPEKLAADAQVQNEKKTPKRVQSRPTRRQKRASERTKHSLLTVFAAWSSFAGFYCVITLDLGYSVIDAIVGLLAGLLISGLAKSSLLVHNHSALQRASAVFGAQGSRLIVALCYFVVFLWGGFYLKKTTLPFFLDLDLSQHVALEIDWLVPILSCVILAALVGVLSTSRSIGAVLIAPTIITIAGTLIALNPRNKFIPTIDFSNFTLHGSLELALFVSVLSTMITVFIRPHSKANAIEIFFGHAMAGVLASTYIYFLHTYAADGTWSYLVLSTAIFLTIALATVSLKDYYGRTIGTLVLAGSAFLTAISLVFFDGSVLGPYLDGFLVAVIVLTTFDSWMRSAPLHSPSFVNKYGFYSGWSISSVMIIGITLGVSSPHFNAVLLNFGIRGNAFLNSICVAMALACLRWIVVHNQDKEVRKVETVTNP